VRYLRAVDLSLIAWLAVALVCLGCRAGWVRAQVTREQAALFVDFTEPAERQSLRLSGSPRFVEGAFGRALEFTSQRQAAELDFSGQLDAVTAVTVGGWFQPRRSGEQLFLSRGELEIAPQGERLFRPQDQWVNFLLGTDHRGFLMGTVHGNGHMPFPHVTLAEPTVHFWNQLVVVKTSDGFHEFYHNGTLVHEDRDSISSGIVRPFRDEAGGDALRIAMALGGLVGEVWVLPRALSAAEVAADYEAKRQRYQPAVPGKRVALREMNSHPAAGLWDAPLDAARWEELRPQILVQAQQMLGEAPVDRVPLDPQQHGDEDCGSYIRRKVSLAVQPGDRMPAYLLIPKHLLTADGADTGRDSHTANPSATLAGEARAVPAIVCFYGTTSGAGKDTTVGLSGRAPGTPPHPNLSMAVDMVEAGYVALAADYLRDGERVAVGKRPYDTTDFYDRYPHWSVHGKDAWDTSRAIDYLETLPFVDAQRIGMVGHSYGGHSTLFTAAVEPRIRVAVANGPVSDFIHHGLHWGVPRGAGNSQSLPNMRPYVLDPTQPLPVTFYEFTALLAPRPLLVGQAVGEQRPMEEENYAAVREVYQALGAGDRVRYHWYAGDHDFPPVARRAAVDWFRRWLDEPLAPVRP
jgi:hypothetical protein